MPNMKAPGPAQQQQQAPPNLSQQQFGGTQPAQAQQPNTPNPTSSFMAPAAIPPPPSSHGAGPQHQQHTGMQTSYGSIATAAAWRQPRGRVLPLGRGTFGSTFQPFS
jgi:hypothetical protein